MIVTKWLIFLIYIFNCEKKRTPCCSNLTFLPTSVIFSSFEFDGTLLIKAREESINVE